METYPKTLDELETLFPTEEACRNYIADLRWSGGFQCGTCGGVEDWNMGNGLLLCKRCRHQQSVLAGTVFHRTHLPLRTWFRAMWLLCSAKNGMSALHLQRQLGLRSYNTAWLCLHKLRRSMFRPGRDRLSGEVEVDETYLGGQVEGKGGRGAFGKQIVLVAVERKKEKGVSGIGRIRLARIPNVQAATLEKRIAELIEPGSTVITDGWCGYNSLGQKGYPHSVVFAAYRDPGEVVLPQCHLVARLMKRWVLGTLQGSVGADHVEDYLNEFVFRFNRRRSKSRGLLFYRLMEQVVSSPPVPRKDIMPQHIVGG